ncbi:MAG TPA: Rad52/Rad22 family DNA repair protein, partial [Sphingomicrobium sp.]
MFDQLAAEFPRDAVHWRAQTVTKAGDKALALAYLDARDVMDRLDAVCTPAGWRNIVVETPKGRLIATIEIKFGDEWIGKTDGAGDTAVEGEKGGISDALKRAAVLW